MRNYNLELVFVKEGLYALQTLYEDMPVNIGLAKQQDNQWTLFVRVCLALWNPQRDDHVDVIETYWRRFPDLEALRDFAFDEKNLGEISFSEWDGVPFSGYFSWLHLDVDDDNEHPDWKQA